MEQVISYQEVPSDETKEKRKDVETEDHEESNWKYFFRQLMVCSCLWTGYFMTGLIQGSPTVILPQLRREANSADAVSDEMASWMSSIIMYAAIPWAFIMPVLSNYIGRKYVMFFATSASLVSFILLYLSKSSNEILIAFSIKSLYLVCNWSVCLIIITEYISPKNRGVFLTMKSAMFGWGVWTANAIGTFSHWKNIALLGIVVAATSSIVILFWPESPYWLAANNKFGRCSQAYRWLRGTSKASEKELEELLESQKIDNRRLIEKNCRKNCAFGNMNVITQKEFYKPLFLCWIVLGIYILSAKLICTIYAIDVLKKFTNSESTAYTGMLILDGISVAGMYFGCITSKFFRRRTLLILLTSCSIVFLLIMSAYLFVIGRGFINENVYLTIFFLMLYSVSVSSGPFIMSTSIIGELIPLRQRNLFLVCYSLMACLFCGTSLKLSLWMFRTMTLAGTFLFYGCSCSFFLYLAYKLLPETKDKTLVEIQKEF